MPSGHPAIHSHFIVLSIKNYVLLANICQQIDLQQRYILPSITRININFLIANKLFSQAYDITLFRTIYRQSTYFFKTMFGLNPALRCISSDIWVAHLAYYSYLSRRNVIRLPMRHGHKLIFRQFIPAWQPIGRLWRKMYKIKFGWWYRTYDIRPLKNGRTALHLHFCQPATGSLPI